MPPVAAISEIQLFDLDNSDNTSKLVPSTRLSPNVQADVHPRPGPPIDTYM